MKRDLDPGRWSQAGEAVSDSAARDSAGEQDWRAQADEGGCADWGISWAFDPRPEVQEPITGARAVVACVIAAAVISLILIAMFDKGLVSWPPL